MILLASASVSALARYTECLNAFGLVLPLSHYQLLAPALANLHPAVLMLDYSLPGLEGVEAVATLHRRHPTTRIIVFGNRLSQDIKIELFIAGISGCCSLTDRPQQTIQLVAAIQQGELCIPRTLVPSLLERLRSHGPLTDTRQQDSNMLSCLTEREKQISLLVGNGHCNKDIARKLGIAERTVKSHLTEIFRKLGIGDRLTLALRLAASSQLAATPPLTLVASPLPPTRLSA